MTEPAPTPAFHRFPWIQLAFCIACLTMAAWTWMRYSYAWTVCDPHFVVFDESCDVDIGAGKAHPMFNRYVRATGISVFVGPASDDGRLYEYRTSESDWPMFIFSVHRQPWAEITIAGRVASVSPVTNDDVLSGLGGKEYLAIDEKMGRLHGASVGGLLVGAMGVFIFGMFLRGWLRERKALASEPPQDMIA